MSFFLKIEKILISRVVSANQLVRLWIRKTSLPDTPSYYVLIGDIPIYPDGTLVDALYLSEGIEEGQDYTVKGELYGGDKDYKETFTFSIGTTVPSTTVAPTTVPATTTLAPTTIPSTTVPATTTEAPTTVAPTTIPPTTIPATTTVPATTTALNQFTLLFTATKAAGSPKLRVQAIGGTPSSDIVIDDMWADGFGSTPCVSPMAAMRKSTESIYPQGLSDVVEYTPNAISGDWNFTSYFKTYNVVINGNAVVNGQEIIIGSDKITIALANCSEY